MTREFFNERADAWDSEHCEQDSTKLEQMVGRLEIKPGASLLDVGSGTGILLPYLLRKVGPEGELVALDYAEEMLRVSRTKHPEPNIRHLHADVTHLPLDNEIFDIVVCYSCFPHFDDKPRAISEINRVMKNHGRLFICHTSSRDEINERHREVAEVEHASFPDENGMRKLLSQGRFGDIKVDAAAASYLTCATKQSRT